MKVTINNKEYEFIKSSIEDNPYRESYFDLVKKVFGLDFTIWYKSGFCDDSFVTYTLFCDGAAVATAGVVVNDFVFEGNPKRFAQISTVATDPEYRGMGLSNFLVERVLDDWRENCDCIYLYANDSVTEFYPKFGFIPADEFMYSRPLTKTGGDFRKLNLSCQEDAALLAHKLEKPNPFSKLALVGGIGITMFHCFTFLRDSIYYIEEHDAVIIADQDEEEMFCYDVYANNDCRLEDLLGIIAEEGTVEVALGFTPKSSEGYTVTELEEGNSTLFVLEGKENIFAKGKVVLPFLSRA
ncbi:MAG: GNAT family N-acetyltransferase [Defluviitaleaceae bacterium]|nr:GNAT family N-acetyltransferase [Defluviitaleaceae bacterium]